MSSFRKGRNQGWLGGMGKMMEISGGVGLDHPGVRGGGFK
jgi:hypothetical protein